MFPRILQAPLDWGQPLERTCCISLKGQILTTRYVHDHLGIDISPISEDIRTLRTLGLFGRGILTRVFLGLHSGSCLQMLVLSPGEQVCRGEGEGERSEVMDSNRGGWVRSSE